DGPRRDTCGSGPGGRLGPQLIAQPLGVGLHAVSHMAKPTIIYFDIRARAEPIRSFLKSWGSSTKTSRTGPRTEPPDVTRRHHDEARVSVITLGVRDLNRAKKFYSEGLGWPIQQAQGPWVCFSLGDGSSALGLFPWEALAGDAGVAADGSGFRGITLSYVVRSEGRADAVLAEAERAGGKIAKPATRPAGWILRLLRRSRWLSLEGRGRRRVCRRVGAISAVVH